MKKKALKYIWLYLPLMVIVAIIAVKGHWLDSGSIILPTGERVDPKDLKSQTVLKSIADQLNKLLPKMVDHKTELQSVEAREGELKYNYIKINATANQFNSEQFMDKMKRQAVDLACHTDMEVFFANGVNARYSFRGKDNKLIGEIVVTPAQCSY